MALEQALYHITGVQELTDVQTNELSSIADSYPYFAPAQFILGLKQKTEGSFGHVAQLQKSLMYFSNPMWMHLQLTDATAFEETLAKEEKQHPNTSNIIYESDVNKEVLYADTKEDDVIESGFVFPELKTEENVEAGFNFPTNNHEFTTAVASKNEDAFNLPNKVIEEVTTPQPFTTTQTNFDIPTLETVRQLLEGKSVQTKQNEVFSNETIHEKETIQEPLKENVASISSSIPSYTFKGFGADDDVNGANAVAISEAVYNDADDTENTTEEHTDNAVDFTNNISSVLTNQLVDFNKPVEKDTKLEFENEALHTIDYFAALGIKIDLTKQPQDKLTVQLRRFTDWLKQMKNVNPNPQDLGTDPELEKAIQNIAKTSIEAREIVTETMADVFIKQGKVDKAIQLYIKLSFLDPHKSTYFANRIQQLKGI